MSLPQQVLLDSTETLYAYVPAEGTWNNIADEEVRIQTPTTSLPDVGSEEAATLETTDYTLAAASKGATQVAFTASSGTAPQPGVRYGIGHATYVQVEPPRVEIAYVDTSGSILHLRDPLPRAVEAGERLKGVRVFHALTAAETDIQGHGLARWKLTLTTAYRGRSVIQFDSDFHIREVVFTHALSEAEAVDINPELARLVAGTAISLREALDSAWDNRLYLDLGARDVDTFRIKSPWLLHAALAYAAHYNLLALREDVDQEDKDNAREEYRDRLEAALHNPNLWITSTEEDTAPPDEESVDDWNQMRLTR